MHLSAIAILPHLLLFLSFFSRHADHRALHSFPTRRSSDLSLFISLSCRPSSKGTTHMKDTLLKINRSEEHTSELQSHSDLVCRLLLEKKKEERRMLATHETVERMHRNHSQPVHDSGEHSHD